MRLIAKGGKRTKTGGIMNQRDVEGKRNKIKQEKHTGTGQTRISNFNRN